MGPEVIITAMQRASELAVMAVATQVVEAQTTDMKWRVLAAQQQAAFVFHQGQRRA